jgi:hypothetical protein
VACCLPSYEEALETIPIQPESRENAYHSCEEQLDGHAAGVRIEVGLSAALTVGHEKKHRYKERYIYGAHSLASNRAEELLSSTGTLRPNAAGVRRTVASKLQGRCQKTTSFFSRDTSIACNLHSLSAVGLDEHFRIPFEKVFSSCVQMTGS